MRESAIKKIHAILFPMPETGGMPPYLDRETFLLTKHPLRARETECLDPEHKKIAVTGKPAILPLVRLAPSSN